VLSIREASCISGPERTLKYKDKSNVSQVAREDMVMPAAEDGARLAASGLQNVIGTVSLIINR
jgi:hypothetical protein